MRQRKLSTSDKRKKQDNSYPRLALVVEQSTREKEMLTICAQIAPFGPSYTKKRGHVIIRYVARQLLWWESRDQLLFAAPTLIRNPSNGYPVQSLTMLVLQKSVEPLVVFFLHSIDHSTFTDANLQKGSSTLHATFSVGVHISDTHQTWSKFCWRKKKSEICSKKKRR